MSTYERGLERLILRISVMDNGWSPTPLKKEMESLAKRLNALVDDLDDGKVACFEIESEHDKEPLPEIGITGAPSPVEVWNCSYKATLTHMKALADSANRAASSLPNSRVRHALPFAAMGLLHLKVWHGQQIGPIDVDSLAVLELESICNRAGIHLGPETFRNAMNKEFKLFDRHFYPPGIWEIISGE